MIDDYAVSIDSQWCSPDYTSVIRCLHADVLCARQVVAEVRLLIDLLAVVDVIPHIGEVGFNFGVGLLLERL